MASDFAKLFLLFIVPAGVLLLLDGEDEPVQVKKEPYYLEFNKDEIFKNLIATEGHFRNVEETNIDDAGFMNCAVKHLADAEGHADEAISHSQIAADEKTSAKFKQLRNKIRDLRHDVQHGTVSPGKAIEYVRETRHYFEEFNPEFDISKCKACEIKVEMKL